MAEPGTKTPDAPALQAPQTAEEMQLPSAQALQSSAQMKLLNSVDELRAQGLGEITALPQLIVCGDQSSGKSSVLEALSGVPFPRKDGVCTRFATEVILRREKSVSMKVSIAPSVDLPKEDQERLQAFQHDIASKEDFADLFEKAKKAMGVSDQKKSFSKSILRVEFRGPEQPQLTLVDLPGLIHARTGTQTKDDIQLVNDLVGSYLKNPRSIILAVVSAKNDANNQVITEKVRDVDPQGKRALGIITKPDTVGSNEEAKWIKLASNEDVKFDLGWHVVKNLDLGMENASQKIRDEQETDFFKNRTFSVLPSQIVGITTLRTRLSKVLFHQIQTTLPKLLEDIESRIRATKAIRDKLGPGRTTAWEQRNYLIELSQSFYTICRDAIGGHYDHEFFREDLDESRRLCANLMNKHFEFAKTLRKKGASWKISDKAGDDDDDTGDESDDEAFRTREEAIKEACKVLKYSRGPEVIQNLSLVSCYSIVGREADG
jgi:GTP-binding protein EngB required for normal cell division